MISAYEKIKSILFKMTLNIIIIFMSLFYMSSAEYCPCHNQLTCIDEEINKLQVGIADYKSTQEYYNKTFNEEMSALEHVLGLPKYEFPTTRSPVSIPICTFSEQETDDVYRDKVKYLNSLDINFVTIKKRYEDIFGIFNERLQRIVDYTQTRASQPPLNTKIS